MKRAASALAALATASVALAQQTAQPTPAEPRTGPTPQEQTTPSANSSGRLTEADKQALMNKCVTQVHAANPNVPQKDIAAYCDKEIKAIASPR